MKAIRGCTALGALAAAVLLSACTQRVADFTLLSTKNVELSRAAELVRGSARAEGRDEEATILIFSTGIPDVKAAVDAAIESVPGAVALADGVIYSEVFILPPLGGSSAYIVEGTPLIDPKLVDQSERATPASQEDENSSESSSQGRLQRRF